MYSINDRSAIGQRRVRVDFSRNGWSQFEKLNKKLGTRYIRAFILKRELVLYLTEHEASGYGLDTECQEVRYDDGIFLLLHKSGGVWYITDVFAAEAADSFEPVYCWCRIKRGVDYLLSRILLCWRQMTRKVVPQG